MREMLAADVPALAAIEGGAGEARNPAFLQLALAQNPQGCCVITHDGAVRGACCLHAAGPISAITLLLAAAGAEHDAHLKALLRQAVEAANARHSICLIHTPHDAHAQHMALMRAGFQALEPVFVLRRALAATDDTAGRLQTTKNVVWQDVCGVDAYGAALEQAQLGKVVRLHGDEGACGIAVLELVARRQGSAAGTAFVSAGNVVRGLGCGALVTLLTSAGALARQQGRTHMFCTLNGYYHRELAALLEHEWQVVRAVPRWVLSKTIAQYKQWLMQPQVDFSHWSL
jgi:hypothetical protein